MKKFLSYFMADAGGDIVGGMGGEAGAGSSAPADPAPEVDMFDEPETGSTTPDEVAEVLHLPKTAPAADEGANDADDTKPEDDEIDDGSNADNKPNDAGGPAETKSADAAFAEPPKTEVKAADQIVDDTKPDFSFTVEDANGNTFKIQPGDTMESALADFTPKNNGQIIDVLAKLQQANTQAEQYETEQREAAAEADRNERVAAIQAGWEKEAKAMVADGRLDNKSDLMNSDKVKAAFDFMRDENTKREADGRAPISSLEDAFNAMTIRDQRAESAQAKTDRKTDARARGSLVGGASAPSTSGDRVYHPGTARNADQALRQLGLYR